MTEPMSREEAYSILKCGEPGGFSIRGVVDTLRDLAKSRPIDLGDGVTVARLEDMGPPEGVYRIRTDQPAAEEQS